MLRMPQSRRRRVKALTDPQPEFVSLVKAGANMTPFRALRADVVEDSTPAETEVVAEKSEDAPEAEVSFKADTHEIARVVFQKSAFADVEAVKSWLDDGGYETTDLEIAEKGETFEVGDLAEGATREIALEGMTVYVVEKTEEGDPAEKASAVVEEVSVKSDEPAAEVVADPIEAVVLGGEPEVSAKSEEAGETVAKQDPMTMDLPVLIAKGEDGLPVVVSQKSTYDLHDVAHIFEALSWVNYSVGYYTEDGHYPDGVEAAIKAAMSALGTALVGIAQATVEAAQKSEEIPTETVEVEKAEEAPVETVEAEKAEEVVATDAVVEATSEVEATKTESEPTVKDLLSLVAKMADEVSNLTKTVDNLQKQTATKSEEDLAERVDATERQIRKGADIEEVSTTSSVSKGSNEFQSLALRGALGIRRRT